MRTTTLPLGLRQWPSIDACADAVTGTAAASATKAIRPKVLFIIIALA
jgi:hypothetical protein